MYNTPCHVFCMGKGCRMRAHTHCLHSRVTGLFVPCEPRTGCLINTFITIKIVGGPNPVFHNSLAPDNDPVLHSGLRQRVGKSIVLLKSFIASTQDIHGNPPLPIKWYRKQVRICFRQPLCVASMCNSSECKFCTSH